MLSDEASTANCLKHNALVEASVISALYASNVFRLLKFIEDDTLAQRAKARPKRGGQWTSASRSAQRCS